MRNKYGREKRKWKAANKSGAGAKDVNVPKILKLLNWLEPYFVERDTSTNFEPTQSVELDEGDEEEEINDDFDNRSVGSEDSFMSAIVTKPNEASQQKNNVKKYHQQQLAPQENQGDQHSKSIKRKKMTWMRSWCQR